MSSGQVLVYENPEENWLAEITCERKNLKSRVQSKEIIKVLRKKSAAAGSNKSHTWQEALQQHFKVQQQNSQQRAPNLFESCLPKLLKSVHFRQELFKKGAFCDRPLTRINVTANFCA